MRKQNKKIVERHPANPDRPEKVYSERINLDTLTEIGKGVNNLIVIARKYREMSYSAAKLAAALGTNTRYLSAAISYRYGCNYSELVNRMRIEDAKVMLENPDCSLTLEDIAYSVGFANRQSFYTAFNKHSNISPRQYRESFRHKPSSNFTPMVEFDDTPIQHDDTPIEFDF